MGKFRITYKRHNVLFTIPLELKGVDWAEFIITGNQSLGKDIKREEIVGIEQLS